MTRGGWGSKVHLITDARGLPIAFVLTEGNRNECPVFDDLLDRAPAGSGGALPDRPAADRGYGADAVRASLSAMGVEPVIPYRRTGHVADRPAFNGPAYRGRNVVERCVGRLKEMRRIGTRYEKLAGSYEAMLTLGMAVLYLRALT
jgi:transposase